jgi:hypothetical protein
LQRAEFVGRDNFGEFLNRQGLKGHAVEVGTHRGAFAHCLLSHWKGKRLFCIDPWLSGYDDNDPASRSDRDDDYRAAIETLSTFGERAVITRKLSADAVTDFYDDSLHFVYIDGNHQPEFVRLDLEVWWPKLGMGGLLAGHDVVCPPPADEWGWSIQPAVLSFASMVTRTVYLVTEDPPAPWSYYMVK